MVQQDAKKLGLRFQARVQYELYQELFQRRLAGEKLLINKGMECQFTSGPATSTERDIAGLIEKWHKKEIAEIETDIFKQKERLAKAEQLLKNKTTKKALEDQRIATQKIEKGLMNLKRHKSSEMKSESEQRIFPFHFMSMLCLNEKGELVIRPYRYHMRPHDKDVDFDREYNGCYNARLDNLKRVRWWSDALGKRHGLILVSKFYENVSTQRYLENHSLPKEKQALTNLVLCFEPEKIDFMLIPTLWDVWKKPRQSSLYSAALITDDPLPEIADAGHDRTPIFLKESAVLDWLRADSHETALKVLQERERPHYVHRVLGVAA